MKSLKSRHYRVLSQVSKGTLITAGVTFITEAINKLKSNQPYLALGLGILGFLFVVLFIILVEKQAEDRAFSRFLELLEKSKKKT